MGNSEMKLFTMRHFFILMFCNVLGISINILRLYYTRSYVTLIDLFGSAILFVIITLLIFLIRWFANRSKEDQK